MTDFNAKFFTVSPAGAVRMARLTHFKKPEFKDWAHSSTFCGWITVHVPNWTGTHAQFSAATETVFTRQ